jgi:hypothetical protein
LAKADWRSFAATAGKPRFAHARYDLANHSATKRAKDAALKAKRKQAYCVHSLRWNFMELFSTARVAHCISQNYASRKLHTKSAIPTKNRKGSFTANFHGVFVRARIII